MPYRQYPQTSRGGYYSRGEATGPPQKLATPSVTPAAPVPPPGSTPLSVPSLPSGDVEMKECRKPDVGLHQIKNGGGISKKQGKEKKHFQKNKARRLVPPKSPYCVLTDLLGGAAVTTAFTQSNPRQEVGMCIPLFNCTLTVNNRTYSGIGPSKDIAKNIASEQAVAFLIKERHGESVDKIDLDEDAQTELNKSWEGLTSLAVFKLFNEWKSQGLELPAHFTSGSLLKQPPSTPQAEFVMKPLKKLPLDPSSKHPVMLLNELMGSTKPAFVETSVGSVPHQTHICSIVLGGNEYKGTGTKKKEAKKQCAMNALAGEHNIKY